MTTRQPHPHDALSDLELLAGWRAGDRSMGSSLYKRYADPIAGFFRRNLRDRAEAEDYTHETFIALRASKAEIESVSGYLFRIAFFKFTRYLRNLKGLPELREGEDDGFDGVAGEILPDSEFICSQREDMRLLLRAIRRLTLSHQQVLELSFWEHRSGPEIAAILGIPLGTVASRLREAKKDLEVLVPKLADSQEAVRATTLTLAEWQLGIQQDLPAAPPDGPRSKK